MSVLYKKNNMAFICIKKKLLGIDSCVPNYFKLILTVVQGDDEFREVFQEFIGCCS